MNLTRCVGIVTKTSSDGGETSPAEHKQDPELRRRYTDNAHFYSFIGKPDGWGLAKEDAVALYQPVVLRRLYSPRR